MNNFHLSSHQLPCVECRKNTAEADLGWLTPEMEKTVRLQLEAIINQNDYEDDLVVNLTCTPQEARDYLLLNAYGYSEEEINDDGIDDDDNKDIEDEISENTDKQGLVAFGHEIALQCCPSCEAAGE